MPFAKQDAIVVTDAFACVSFGGSACLLGPR